MDVVEVAGVRKTYESEGMPVRALRGADLTVGQGEFVAVMGPSGCGKSTLLNLIAGLDTPTEGEIKVAGESLDGKDENDLARMRRRHIGIVFQFFNLLEGMSVLENVALPAIIAGMGRKQAETRARDLLDLLGLADKAKNAPGVLSGGQRQRLALARAFLLDPPLLILDEATSALDAETERVVHEAIRTLARGRTTLIIAHRLATVRDADRILLIDRGLIVATGTHDHLLATCPAYVHLVRHQMIGGGDAASEAEREARAAA